MENKPEDKTTDVEEKVEDKSSTEDTSVETADKPKTKKKSKVLLAVLIVVLLVLIAGVAYLSWTMLSNPDNKAVATVNDEKITQAEFNSFFLKQQPGYEAQGLDVTNEEQMTQAKDEALNLLIEQTLLLQAAEENGIEVTTEEINQQIESIKGQYEDDATFQQALTDNNLTLEQLKNNFRTQLTIEKYLEPKVDIEPAVSEQEVQELYDFYAEQSDQIPPFEEVSTQLEDQIKQQKINQAVNQIVEGLKEAAEIEKL